MTVEVSVHCEAYYCTMTIDIVDADIGLTPMAIAGKYFDMVKAAVREAGYTVNGKKGTY